MVLLLLWSPVSGRAQERFRSGTTLVEVDTIVTDKKGAFVEGLTPGDFEVLEDGKPQQIERMYVVDGRSAKSIPAARASDSATPAAFPRVFLLVFDSDNLNIGAFKRLQNAAVDFFTHEFHDGDFGGVVIGNAMANNQITTNREALISAVRAAKPSPAKAARRADNYEWPRLSDIEAVRIAVFGDGVVMAQAVARACADDPSSCQHGMDPRGLIKAKADMLMFELRPASQNTLGTLDQLASGLSKLPGRKTVILMTEGFFVEDSWADVRQIVGAAARSNVRFYTIDALGLRPNESADVSLMNPMRTAGDLSPAAFDTSGDGPNMLAVDTGGRVIRNTNNFASALSEIARDTSRYYVLGYNPTTLADGSFRRIVVRVKRKGLTVRARRGYLATPLPAAAVAVSAAKPAAAPAPAALPPAAPSASSATIPTPEPVTGTVVAAGDANASPAGFRLRPDASHVRDLASRDAGAEPAESLASQGWDRYQKGDLEGAADLLGKAAADPEARPWVQYALGYSELGLRQIDRAARAWEQVRAAVPEFRTVYLDLADAYMQMKDYSHAAGVLQTAENRWPGDIDVLNALGTIQVQRGALDDAIKTFKRATEAHPDDALAWFNLGRTHELRYFKMRRYLRSAGGWVSTTVDREEAMKSYEAYLKIGGPYEDLARKALKNLRLMPGR